MKMMLDLPLWGRWPLNKFEIQLKFNSRFCQKKECTEQALSMKHLGHLQLYRSFLKCPKKLTNITY